MVQGGMSVVKYLMFIFNFVFVVCGLALVIVGAIAQSSGNKYAEFVGSKYVTAPTITIIVGVVIFFIAFLGCWGALRENHCMVATFGVLLFIIFVIEIAAGITAYVYKDSVNDVIQKSMNESFKIDSDSKLWADLQNEMHCCGVNGPSDYDKGKNSTDPEKKKLPQSCCEKGVEECYPSGEGANKDGCFQKLKDYMEHKIVVIGGVGFGIAVIEILGMIFAWCLASSIRGYEGV